MRYLFPVLFLVCYGPSASAALIQYYRMDSLAFLASDIVLCDEVKSDQDQATFTVVEVFKGGCKPKQKLVIEFDRIYTRQIVTFLNQKGEVVKVPPGRVLLFLNKKTEGAREAWRPVIGGVKPVVNGETYCYGQFGGNPGPLYLARMAPENIEVPETTAYDEKLLIKDLKSALEKAKGLKKPEPISPRGAGITRAAPKGK